MTAVAYAFVVTGAILMALSGLGVLRLPDVLARLQAGTKAASLGLACVFAGAALLEPSVSAVVKLALSMLFVFTTAPVAGHVIGRAAYEAGVPLWEDTWVDEALVEMGEDEGAAGDGGGTS
ncbi:MAG TPA: monovalent cation/H(+) antiporter subunit G [Thermoleophilia bacterium]|nr:monovalent cation/H(+) antiporter subunit G [Thermoleophilia bacterium]